MNKNEGDEQESSVRSSSCSLPLPEFRQEMFDTRQFQKGFPGFHVVKFKSEIYIGISLFLYTSTSSEI